MSDDEGEEQAAIPRADNVGPNAGKLEPRALQAQLGDAFLLHGEFGVPEGGTRWFLAAERASNQLVLVKLSRDQESDDTENADDSWSVDVVRALDASVPAFKSSCPSCGSRLKSWARLCRYCGADQAALGPEAESAGALQQVLLQLRARYGAWLDVLGHLPRVSGGGVMYFARDKRIGGIVALRLRGSEASEGGVEILQLQRPESFESMVESLPTSGAEPPEPRDVPTTSRSAPTMEGQAQSTPPIVVSADAAPPDGTVDTTSDQSQSTTAGGNYRVWFATNRTPVMEGNRVVDFDGTRSTGVTYGDCVVHVPASHKVGSLGSSWWRRLWTRVDDRLHINSLGTLEADTYWAQLHAHLQSVAADRRDGVIFVHGFNVSFKDAALRAAQIGYDLQIDGGMAFFSWPSRGDVSAYMADEAAIEASERHIAQFLVDFAEHSGAERVHVIAHSMGNRGVLRAVNRIVGDAELRAKVRMTQLILAAPDVDTDVFMQLATAYRQVAHRTTLYISDRDRAVELSSVLHGAPRAGFAPPVVVVPDIDTVHVSNVDLTMLGHGYVAEARDVLHDMFGLIRHDKGPDERMGLRRLESATGEGYWSIGA